MAIVPLRRVDERAGQRSPECRCRLASSRRPRSSQQELDLAELGRSFIAGTVDRTMQQAQPDLVRQRQEAPSRRSSDGLPSTLHQRCFRAIRHGVERRIRARKPHARACAMLRASIPSCASSGISLRQRGRVNVVSRLVGSSANGIFALSSVAISRAFGDIQQRPHDDEVAANGSASHRRKPRKTAAARQAHQERLGLIVQRMRGQNADRARLARGLREQRVARLARGRGNSARRFCAGPAHRRVRDAERGGELLHRARFGAPTSLRKP